MTTPRITGVELAGLPTAPLLVVGPSLGTSVSTLWSSTAEHLADRFHVVGWELPGHGGAPSAEPFTMAELAAGVRTFVDGVRQARGGPTVPFAYAGDSVGGAVGLQLLLDVPEQLLGAVLLATGATIGTPDGWVERAATVRGSGTAAVLTGSAERWFAPGFVERHPDVAAPLLGVLQDADREQYARVCEALATFDVTERLQEIEVPVLAVAGALDQATPPGDLLGIATGVRDGSLVVLPDVAHLPPAEAPSRVAEVLARHLLGNDAARHAAGMSVRRSVLGDAHVDRAIAGTTELTQDFQDFITRYAWGTVWTRPGLDRRSRSMITLTALIARAHHEELAMHVRAALRNGLTRDEIGEVILQSAVYCGVPDANTAFRIAQQAFDQEDA